MGYPCPCCGYLTFSEPTRGTFEICPVCFWEDDNVQTEDPIYEGGANRISLLQAKKNFVKYRAVKKEFISAVRSPLLEEIPTI
jgi:hypothetical protein